MEKDYYVRTVGRVMSILKCFDADHREIGLLEFAGMLELNKSTVYRLLCNLVDGGFLDVNPDGKYTVSHEIVRLSSLNEGYNYLKRISRRLMMEAASFSKETVVLTSYTRGQAICIDRVEQQQVLRVSSEIGRKVPMVKGSTGKVILAFLDEDERDWCLQIQEELFHLPYERAQLEEELRSIREYGYCNTVGELNANVASLAVPLVGAQGQILGSLAVLAPETRIDADVQKRLTDWMLEGVLRFSSELSGS